jgi:hypothetical protein
MNQQPPPIAVFAYKRPAHLQLCLEHLKRSMEACGRDFELFIFCDAPRKDEDRPGCSQVQEIAKKWPGAHAICREKNYGFRNITEGISTLCKSHGKAIAIEDDVLVHKDFLPFMLLSMERYENEAKVFMVSGFMYHGMENYEREAFFLRSPFIWGWGVWERSWRHFEWKPEGWKEFLEDKKEKSLFDFYGSIPFSKNLEKTLTGRWNTWDAQWMFCHFKQGGLALYPSRSLVWNCGVGGGVHGSAEKDQDPLLCDREGYLHGNLSLEDFQQQKISQNLLLGKSFPVCVECDKRAMRKLAIIFLKERLRKGERKKWRLRFKLLLQALLLPFTKSP